MFGWSIVVWSLLFVASAESDEGSSLNIHTTSGLLRGKSDTILNKKIKLFLGVPFAQPPTGNLRFLPPREFQPSTPMRDATIYAPSCYQPPHLKSVISPLLTPNIAEISEDCLYLNIFAPESNDTNLPVMIWIAGEGFDYADPQQFDGSYLAAEGNAIVITVNYRVSVFGFLSSQSSDAPGNVGLLDQRMAFKWVKNNIENFGGNPGNVTLFGRFTGAMSVAIHAFSPLSRQESLFERVILQSGVPVGDWVYDRNPLSSTSTLAADTNCSFPLIQNTIKCLRNLPAELLLKSAISLPERFRPVYDFHLIYKNILDSIPSSAPVDVMVGINNDEGSLCTLVLKAMQSPLYNKIVNGELSEDNFSELIHSSMLEVYKQNNTLMNKIAVHEYKGANLRKMYTKFCGDIYITSRAQKLADIVSEQGMNTYMYEFAHRPSFSINPTFIRAGHGDDVLYSFGLPLKLSDLPEDEIRLTKRMVQAFVNFARNGNPNSVRARKLWPRYTYLERELMSFTTFRDKTKSVEKSSHDDAVFFWNTIIPEIQQCPSTPDLPVASGLVAEKPTINSIDDHTYFLGKHVTLPVAEYMIICLVGASGGFFIMFIVGLTLWLKVKRSDHFQRLA